MKRIPRSGLLGAVLLAVLVAAGLALAAPAKAIATGTIAVCATDSTGANILVAAGVKPLRRRRRRERLP
jgi:hypothetical protein